MSLSLTVNRHKHEHFQLVVGLTGSADIDRRGLAAHLDVNHACTVPADIYYNVYGLPNSPVLVSEIEALSSAFHKPNHPDYNLLNPLFECLRWVLLDQGMRQLTHVFIQKIRIAELYQQRCRHMARTIPRHQASPGLCSPFVERMQNTISMLK